MQFTLIGQLLLSFSSFYCLENFNVLLWLEKGLRYLYHGISSHKYLTNLEHLVILTADSQVPSKHQMALQTGYCCSWWEDKDLGARLTDRSGVKGVFRAAGQGAHTGAHCRLLFSVLNELFEEKSSLEDIF